MHGASHWRLLEDFERHQRIQMRRWSTPYILGGHRVEDRRAWRAENRIIAFRGERVTTFFENCKCAFPLVFLLSSHGSLRLECTRPCVHPSMHDRERV
jgi:hypothetical protein